MAGKRKPARTSAGELPAIPPLTATPDAVEAYTSAVEAHMRAGVIEAVIGRELMKAATVMNTVIRTRHGLDEIDNLRRLVERQEAALRERKAREVGDRHARTEVGEFAVADEQEKTN